MKNFPNQTGSFYNGYCWQPIDTLKTNPINLPVGTPVGVGAVRPLMTPQMTMYAQQPQQFHHIQPHQYQLHQHHHQHQPRQQDSNLF